MFFQKFKQLISFIRGRLDASSSLSRINKYILVRDATFFVIDFFTGGRASDLGRLLSGKVSKFKDREGYLLTFTFTKTLRSGATRSFPLVKFTEQDVCPVAWIRYYLLVCSLLDIPLAGGYFFRATNCRRDVSDRPFWGTAVNNRLRKYL